MEKKTSPKNYSNWSLAPHSPISQQSNVHSVGTAQRARTQECIVYNTTANKNKNKADTNQKSQLEHDWGFWQVTQFRTKSAKPCSFPSVSKPEQSWNRRDIQNDDYERNRSHESRMGMKWSGCSRCCRSPSFWHVLHSSSHRSQNLTHLSIKWENSTPFTNRDSPSVTRGEAFQICGQFTAMEKVSGLRTGWVTRGGEAHL